MEDQLKQILNSTYGGPSLSYENGNFVIYEWYDAPSDVEILGKGKTLDECIKDCLSRS